MSKKIKYGLIGNPLGQSYSPVLHKMFGDYDYQLCQLEKSELLDFFRTPNFKGINVTIPYKEMVIPYLDEIDPLAKEIGAINTIVKTGEKLIGYNTDILGLNALLEKNNIEIEAKKVLILGTGGTSKTAKVLCQKLKAKKVYLVSRVKSDDSISYAEAEKLKDIQVIINTTPVGMYGENIDQSPISLDSFSNLEAVVDVIYNPLKTKLMFEAEKKGIKTCNGLYMLVMQAYYASQLFLKNKINLKTNDLQDEAYQRLLAQMANIVLIGMPSSGKTTVGLKLAEITNRSFIDTDHLIEEKEKMHPSKIIEKKGEAYFRAKETEVIKEVASQSGQVIATGGGSILAKENQMALQANSKIYFLDRALEELTPTKDRPLTASIEDLEEKYQERYPIYQHLANEVIIVNDLADQLAEKIKEIHFNDNI